MGEISHSHALSKTRSKHMDCNKMALSADEVLEEPLLFIYILYIIFKDGVSDHGTSLNLKAYSALNFNIPCVIY